LANWNEPLRWQAKADAFEASSGHRRRVFCGSMMDIMDNAVPLAWSYEAFDRIENCDRLDWQLLTKRVGNVPDRVPERWLSGGWPRHVGLMITTVTQAEIDRDVPKLLALKAAHDIPWVGLSVEPLLERVTFRWAAWQPINRGAATGHLDGLREIDWVIVGGESGAGARAFDTAWAEALVDECREVAIPCFVKQLGANVLKHGSACPKSDKKGGNMAEWPETIRIRQMPLRLAA